MAVIMVRTGRIKLGTQSITVRTDRINVGTHVIIVGTDRYVVGTRGNEGSARGNACNGSCCVERAGGLPG